MSEVPKPIIPEGVTEFLRDSSVFEYALKKQRELETKWYDNPSEAIGDLVEAIHELDSMAAEQGVIGKAVKIIGDEIYASGNMQINPINGVVSPSMICLTRDSLGFPLELEKTGKFSGFTYAVPSLPLQDSGEAGLLDRRICSAQLCYQLQSGEVSTPFFQGTLCAFSAIEKSRIEFLEDTEKQKEQQAFERLSKYEDLEVMGAAYSVNKCLSDEEKYANFNLKQSARHVRRMLNRKKDSDGSLEQQLLRDDFIDFVRGRLQIDGVKSFYIEASGILIFNPDTNDVQPSAETILSAPVIDVVFQPHFMVTPDGDARMEEDRYGDELSLVVEVSYNKGNYTAFVPLEKIKNIAPID